MIEALPQSTNDHSIQKNGTRRERKWNNLSYLQFKMSTVQTPEVQVYTERLTHATSLVADVMSDLCWPWYTANRLTEPEGIQQLWLRPSPDSNGDKKPAMWPQHVGHNRNFRHTLWLYRWTVKRVWVQLEHGLSCCVCFHVSRRSVQLYTTMLRYLADEPGQTLIKKLWYQSLCSQVIWLD